VRPHDLIVSFNGEPATGVDTLSRQLTDAVIGESLPLVVVRGPDRRTLRVIPQEH
jgi:S1-C subfamily serine protease